MIGRVTLREVRKALAAAKAREAKGSATSPTVEELETLARTLERQAAASAAGDPMAEEPAVKRAVEQGAAADGGGRRGSRRSTGSRGPRGR